MNMMSAGLGGSAALLLRLSVSRFASPMLRPGCAMPARAFSSSLPRCSSLEPPDIPRLADTARISITAAEVEDFAPKIGQVIDWFGQLQAVDLGSIEPSLRADTEVSTSQREDTPEAFENRDALITAVSSYDDPYLKVPRVLNKEQRNLFSSHSDATGQKK